MNSLSKLTLKPIIDSRGGIHLTVYLEHTKDVSELKLQIRESINTAKELLATKMTLEAFGVFMTPLLRLMNDERTLKSLRYNVGIFRTENSFRMINVPVEVQHLTIVADSFHVKPLLKWIQTAKKFAWIDFREQDCRVFVGDERQIKLLDTFTYPTSHTNLRLV